jgi:hypothetical protein
MREHKTPTYISSGHFAGLNEGSALRNLYRLAIDENLDFFVIRGCGRECTGWQRK